MKPFLKFTIELPQDHAAKTARILDRAIHDRRRTMLPSDHAKDCPLNPRAAARGIYGWRCGCAVTVEAREVTRGGAS